MYQVLLAVVVWAGYGQAQFMRGTISQEDILYDTSDCTIQGEPLYHSQVKYLLGDSTMRGSIYARCWNGAVQCHVEEAIPDKKDSETVPCDQVNHPKYKRRLQLVANNPWPLGVVCYAEPNPNLFSAAERDIIQQSFADFAAKTAISFITNDVCTQQPNAAQLCGNCQNYLQFIKDGDACYSLMGYQAEPAQVVSIGTDCFRERDFIIIHELGHAVGMYHEHSHPDRNLVILRDSVPPDTSPQNYAKARDTKAYMRAYDIDSVMHYPLDAAMCIPKDDVGQYCDFGQRGNCKVATEADCNRDDPSIPRAGPDLNGLSIGDVQALAAVYGNGPAGPSQGPDTPAAPGTAAPVAVPDTAAPGTVAPVAAPDTRGNALTALIKATAIASGTPVPPTENTAIASGTPVPPTENTAIAPGTIAGNAAQAPGITASPVISAITLPPSIKRKPGLPDGLL